MKRIVSTIAAILSYTLAAVSQTGIPSVVQGLHGEAISLNGDIGTYGELYSIAGRDSRRPSSTARLYFRPTLSFYDALTLSFNVLLSTEGSSRSFGHQLNQINQFGINPRWGWGYANVGDFSETFTPYTLSGILVRGGGITVNPGLLRFSAIGGLTRRGGAADGSGPFDRYLYGGKIGIGREQDSFFDIVFLRVRDTPSKFHIVYPDSISVPDSTQVGTNVNSYQDAPQESLVFGFASCLRAFENTLTFRAEASGSAFTRDMGSARLREDNVPSAVRALYAPRLSTNVDYTYNFQLLLNLSPASFKAGLRRVGPGYNSLGVASLITDQREILLGTAVHFSRWAGTFTWSRQNDNLIGQKLNTTIRQTFVENLSIRPLDTWSMSFVGNVLSMRNYASNSAALVDFLTLNVGTTQSIMFDRDGLVQNASFSYMFQKSSDRNPSRTGTGTSLHTLTATSPMSVAKNLTLFPSMGLVILRQGAQPSTTIQTYSLTPQYRAMENKLNASLTLTLSRTGSASSLQVNLSASYRLTESNTIALAIRKTDYRGTGPTAGDYNEHIASLTVSQRL